MIKTLSKARKQERVKFLIPRSVQDCIPIRRIWADGIFQVGHQFSKTWSFTDINYSIAGKDDKTAMFLDYCDLLNALASGASAKITLYNRRINKEEFERSVLLPLKEDGLDNYREEFNEMLRAQVTESNNSIVRERYLTISVVKRNIEEARTYFARVGTDLTTKLAALSSVAQELSLNAGIGHFTFHALRHTFATRALERGMDYKTLSAILGHYSVSFTMDTYVHSMDEHKRNEMDKMDDLFGISLEISVEQQPYPVLFTVTEEGCKAFAPDFPKIQIQAGTMETALMEAKKQIQKALSQFKYPPIPTRQEDIVVPENSVLILLKTA